MPKTIVDIDPREMSFIFGEYKGEKWQPVNADAVVLTVKGEGEKQTIADKVKGVIDTLKAIYFPSDTDTVDVPQSYPVGEDVPDNIDHDGDGAEDYSAYALAICYAAQDINQAMGLQEPARSEAIVAVVDKFRAEAKEQFGDAEKGGARHSKSDMEHLMAIKDAVSNAAQEVDARLASLGVGDTDGETDKGGKEKEGKYGDVAYADEKNKKYPIDTEEHARAAWSYINQEKNASEYDSEDLAKIKARIEAACKKFGIEISKAEPIENIEDVVKGQVEALITAKAAEFEQQIATVKAEAQSQIDTLKAESESRVAQLETQLQEVTQRAEKAESIVKAAVADASKPSSPGFVPTMREDGKRSDPAAEVTKAEAIQNIGKPTTIAEVIKLQQMLRQ